MSSELNKKQSDNAQSREAQGQGLRIGIVAARWNSTITDPMLSSALSTLRRHGCLDDDILVERVPGTVELTYGAALMARHYLTDAVIVIGCVIKGDTPHFDYVCQSVTQGVAALNARGDSPVIFGVLTVNDYDQALERIDGSLADKGAEAAEAAIEMALLRHKALNLRES